MTDSPSGISSGTATGTSTSTGRPGRPGYDRAAVLAIAVDAFNAHGYDATSMGILAKRLGTSKSAIYHHFDSKEEVLRQALEHALGGLEQILDRPLAQSGTGEARLSFVLRESVVVLCERLPYVTLLLRVRGNTEIERGALDRRRAFDHAVATLVDKARDEGSLRSDVDARTTTRLLFGMINSVVEWYRPGGALTPQTLADDVLSVALDGLRTPSRDTPGQL